MSPKVRLLLKKRQLARGVMECVPNVSGAIFLEDGIMPPLNVYGECVWGLIVRFYNIKFQFG